MTIRILPLFLLAFALPLGAQTAREEIAADPAKAAGLHYAYPGPQSVETPAPKGFRPFYISHFGRHGSRWHCDAQDYEAPLTVMEEAHAASALTPLGEEVLGKARAMAEDGAGHLGELTRLGTRQHQTIAERMVHSFPEVFDGEAKITANSTTSHRVMMSMFYFCNTLKKHNPRLEIDLNSSRRDASFVSNRIRPAEPSTYDIKLEKEKLKRKILQPERLMGVLFSNPAYVREKVDAQKFMWDLYYLAEMTQNNELDSLSFLNVFTPDELYDCWRVDNYDMYLYAADPRAQGVTVPSCKPMIAHILDRADEMIASGGHGATLRFSHDSYLVPMAITLRLDGCTGTTEDPERCDEAFIDYKISPMCGNIQLVFFRNRKGEVWVKFLLNENEVGIPLETDQWPYYKWENVRDYYKTLYQL